MDHRLGFDPGVRGWKHRCRRRLVRVFYKTALQHRTYQATTWLVKDYGTAQGMVDKAAKLVSYQQGQLQLSGKEVEEFTQASQNLTMYSSTHLPSVFGHSISVNAPAFVIVALPNSFADHRHPRKRQIQHRGRNRQSVLVVVFFIALGGFYVSPANWHPFIPNGLSGFDGWSGDCLLCLYRASMLFRLRRRKHVTHNRDLPIGMFASLVVCTVLYIGLAAVLTGLKKNTRPSPMTQPR